MNNQKIITDIETIPAEYIKSCLQECNRDSPLENIEYIGNAAFTIVGNLNDETLYKDQVVEFKAAIYELERLFKFNLMLLNYIPDK